MEKTNERKLMILSKCALRDSKKPRFIKKQEASRLLISLGLKTTFSKILLLGDILF